MRHPSLPRPPPLSQDTLGGHYGDPPAVRSSVQKVDAFVYIRYAIDHQITIEAAKRILDAQAIQELQEEPQVLTTSQDTSEITGPITTEFIPEFMKHFT
jgi:hypothetical protein